MALLNGPYFVDTNVIVTGTIMRSLLPGAATRVMDAAFDGRLGIVRTAWHCCLEFFAVTTRLPPEFRVSPSEAARIVQDDILGKLDVRDMDPALRPTFVAELLFQRVVGARIYDSHIAEVARQSRCATVITGNGRHFGLLLRQGIRVMTVDEVALEAGL